MYKRGDQRASGKSGPPKTGKPMKPGKGGKASPAPRRHKRHTGKGKARCELGDVLDISAGGMRIGCAGKPALKPGEAATIRVKTSAGSETLNVRCCWIKSPFMGLGRKHEIGLKFIGITDEQAERLGIIAEYGFIPEHKQTKKPQDEAAANDKSKDDNGDQAAPDTSHLDEELAPHYAALELEPGADANEVRNAYRRLVRTCHPDVTDSEEARAQFLKIQQAYDALRSRAAKPDQKAA
ncbi:MAG: DnaJ domain-containing protein [Planctomycetota bacterium]